MRKCKPQRAVSTHGDSANGPARTPRSNAILAFNLWHELLQKEVTVAHGAVRRVYVKAAPALRGDDEKIAHLALPAEIVEQRPPTTVEERLLIVTEAMQKIEHRISARRMLRRARVVARR